MIARIFTCIAENRMSEESTTTFVKFEEHDLEPRSGQGVEFIMYVNSTLVQALIMNRRKMSQGDVEVLFKGVPAFDKLEITSDQDSLRQITRPILCNAFEEVAQKIEEARTRKPLTGMIEGERREGDAKYNLSKIFMDQIALVVGFYDKSGEQRWHTLAVTANGDTYSLEGLTVAQADKTFLFDNAPEPVSA